MLELNDEVRDFRNKNLLVVAHHPLYSRGWNGNNFHWKDYIVPRKSPHQLRPFAIPFVPQCVMYSPVGPYFTTRVFRYPSAIYTLP